MAYTMGLQCFGHDWAMKMYCSLGRSVDVRRQAIAAVLFGTVFGPTPALADCRLFHPSPATLSLFIDHPGDLLDRYRAGGVDMEDKVASLAGSSPLALAALRTIIPMANAAQIEALGRGLATAGAACRTMDVARVRAIDDFALRSGEDAVANAYRRALLPEDEPDDRPVDTADRPNGPISDMTFNRFSLSLANPFAPVPIKGP